MEGTKIALLVIYNHRFDKNIARVENLYKNRFSNIFHIMPFYDGDVENVIPVYESSYYFQGYVAQAYTHLKRKGFSHFFIIADDLILNPSVSESNIFEKMGIDSDSCWIGGDKIEFQNLEIEWSRLSEALTFSLKVSGVEVSKILPSKEVAVDKFKKFGLSTGKIAWSVLKKMPFRRYKQIAFKYKQLNCSLHDGFELNYPLVGAYSDSFLVTSSVMDKFCSYAGAFAALDLFVEIAVPTALVLASDKLCFDKDVKMHQKTFWTEADVEKIENKYSKKLDLLLSDFSEDCLFLHPIKLSKWE